MAPEGFDRVTKLHLDEVWRRAWRCDAHVGKRTRLTQVELAIDDDVLRTAAIFGEVVKTAEIAADFFQKQAKLEEVALLFLQESGHDRLSEMLQLLTYVCTFLLRSPTARAGVN
jgi:hypothetical protein